MNADVIVSQQARITRLQHRIAALESEVARYRHLGIQYLRWLSVANAEDGIEQDMRNPEMFEGSNLTARSTP